MLDNTHWVPKPGDRVRILTPIFNVRNLVGTVKETPRRLKALGSVSIYVAVPTADRGEIWMPCHVSELEPVSQESAR